MVVVVVVSDLSHQFSQLMSSLTAKPLHGQYYSLLNDNSIDKRRSIYWLNNHLHSETESTILAIQDQVIATRLIEARIMKKYIPSVCCRLCGGHEESIDHLLASLAATEYLYRHNLVAGDRHKNLINILPL